MRKNEIKVALLSLASGTSKITYERLVREYQSVELTAGVIGWGFDKLKDSDPKGTAWRAAYKFIFPNKHNANNQLSGFYIKPELCYSTYRYNHETRGRHKVDRVALMGVLGYDWVLRWFGVLRKVFRRAWLNREMSASPLSLPSLFLLGSLVQAGSMCRRNTSHLAVSRAPRIFSK